MIVQLRVDTPETLAWLAASIGWDVIEMDGGFCVFGEGWGCLFDDFHEAVRYVASAVAAQHSHVRRAA